MNAPNSSGEWNFGSPQQNPKTTYYVVLGFFFYRENSLCSLSVLYSENADFVRRGQPTFGSFFFVLKSSAELTASETFA